jgi:hypothetical protein
MGDKVLDYYGLIPPKLEEKEDKETRRLEAEQAEIGPRYDRIAVLIVAVVLLLAGIAFGIYKLYHSKY